MRFERRRKRAQHRKLDAYYFTKESEHHDSRLQEKVAAEIRQLKENTPCPDCVAEGRPAYHPACVMDFDHVQGMKKFNISQALRFMWPEKVPLIWREIAKCELVCSNHHRIRTFSRGTPHHSR